MEVNKWRPENMHDVSSAVYMHGIRRVLKCNRSIWYFDNGQKSRIEQTNASAILVASSYLEPRVIINGDDRAVVPLASTNSDSEEVEREVNRTRRVIIANAKRILKVVGDKADIGAFRVVSGETRTDVYIKNLKSIYNVEKGVRSDGVHLQIINYVPKHGVAMAIHMVVVTNIDESDDLALGNYQIDNGAVGTVISSQYIIEDKKMIQTIERSGEKDPSLNIGILAELDYILNTIRKHITDIPQEIVHDDFELAIARQAFDHLITIDMMRNYGGFYVPLYTYQNPDYPGKLSPQEDNVTKQLPAMIRNHESWPLVDFNLKENNYTDRYFKRKFKDGQSINLIPYITNARWGDTLRLKSLNGRDGKYHTQTVRFTVNPIDNTGVMWIFDAEDYNTATLVVQIHFRNVDRFTGADNVEWIESGMVLRNTGCIAYHSATEGFNALFDSEMLSSYTDDLHTNVLYALGVFVVIHDRPKRVGMITGRRPRKKHEKPLPGEDPDFIVRRILKPADEIGPTLREKREYQGNVYEFTCEEWERKGHWRRLPHSERMIWVKPTLCHRRQPLSTKEVHLKL